MEGKEGLPSPAPPFSFWSCRRSLWAGDHNGSLPNPWLLAVQTGGGFLAVMAIFSPFVQLQLPRILFELVNSPREEMGRSLPCDREAC